MRAHISLSKRRCLHDLFVISLGKIRHSNQKCVPIAAARDHPFRCSTALRRVCRTGLPAKEQKAEAKCAFRRTSATPLARFPAVDRSNPPMGRSEACQPV